MKLTGRGRLLILPLTALVIVGTLAILAAQQRFDLRFDEWTNARDADHIAALEASRSAGDLGSIEAIAEAGDPEAQFVLAKASCGLGDFDQAIRWLDQAAEQGHYEAMHLRIVLAGPRGSTLADPATAARWRNALSRNDAPGFRAAEPMLSENCVPPENLAVAAAFLEAVFFAEFPYDFDVLGGRYESGDGVEQNLVEAFALITVAHRKVDSSPPGPAYREALAQDIADIEQLLTETEIAAGRRRANEWLLL